LHAAHAVDKRGERAAWPSPVASEPAPEPGPAPEPEPSPEREPTPEHVPKPGPAEVPELGPVEVPEQSPQMADEEVPAGAESAQQESLEEEFPAEKLPVLSDVDVASNGQPNSVEPQ
jgi:hypothetical protein